MNFDLKMFFYGGLIGLVLAVIAFRIGSNLGNSFVDVMDEYFKNKYSKK